MTGRDPQPHDDLRRLWRDVVRDLSISEVELSDEQMIALLHDHAQTHEECEQWRNRFVQDRRLREQLVRLYREGKLPRPSDPAVDAESAEQTENGVNSRSDGRENRAPVADLEPLARALPAVERSPGSDRDTKHQRRSIFSRGWMLGTSALVGTVVVGAALWFTQRPEPPDNLLARAATEFEARHYDDAITILKPLWSRSSAGPDAGRARQLAERATYELLQDEREAGQSTTGDKMLRDAQAGSFDSPRLYVEHLLARRGMQASSAFEARGVWRDFPRDDVNPALREEFESALAKYPGASDLRSDYLHWLLERGEFRQAQTQLEHLVETPQFAIAAGPTLYHLSLRAAGGPDDKLVEALRRLDESLGTDPRNATSLFNRGDVLVKLGRSQEAAAAYRLALQAASDPSFRRRIEHELNALEAQP